ncbi:hypothetical protein ACXHQ0_19440 [Vibrio antiquarius]|uniref:Uncharacterized protein n=1 Tax=Vibrio parahaemolyticus TaxID=670 RepID=A0AA46Z910_VIBPH|nr:MULTISPECIES: hypothetical protein [Vibrio harveyi group]KOE73903.1 hypothetical protein ACS91_29810 [Vibrio parahaemolyticus]MCS0314033.1 hypothetical protein [Vibrio diabolicus]UYV30412.1 hypothetical protein M5598_25730 [Vibrio parahaemolyticus]UYW19578.1 hypothetical protein IF561_24925 [Vibrio parahaemolyticus]
MNEIINIILSVLSISLVSAIALASLYYGGYVFEGENATQNVFVNRVKRKIFNKNIHKLHNRKRKTSKR